MKANMLNFGRHVKLWSQLVAKKNNERAYVGKLTTRSVHFKVYMYDVYE